ncbi:MAG: 2-methylaconitate cis-trans isomerase PrpF family protein [Burkholderiales bacterium]|jgi:2-methylaconitate cis-trans-isomerase PrpF
MKTASHSVDQLAVPCTIMRGGTSKGVFFLESDLPADPQSRERVLLEAIGSPDPRQIDGLGGADTLTSKIVIVSKSSEPGIDLNYTFGQVGIDLPYVSYSANCGNLSAAVGTYAIQQGLIPALEPVTTVHIFNTNTRQVLVSRIPVSGGQPSVNGDCAIAGVPGTGAEIQLDFARTKGASTGSLLPSGNVVDEIYVPELGKSIIVSIVDVAKVTLFFHARDIGIRGTETPDEFTPEILNRFWAIRNAGAKHIGLSPESRLPHPVSVIAPANYMNYMTKTTVRADEVSFVARRVGGPPPRLHKAFAATGAVCTAVAANLPGTVVHQVARRFDDHVVRIGHPTGVFPVITRIGADGEITEAAYTRTARRIMDGTVYVAAQSRR